MQMQIKGNKTINIIHKTPYILLPILASFCCWPFLLSISFNGKLEIRQKRLQLQKRREGVMGPHRIAIGCHWMGRTGCRCCHCQPNESKNSRACTFCPSCPVQFSADRWKNDGGWKKASKKSDKVINGERGRVERGDRAELQAYPPVATCNASLAEANLKPKLQWQSAFRALWEKASAM